MELAVWILWSGVRGADSLEWSSRCICGGFFGVEFAVWIIGVEFVFFGVEFAVWILWSGVRGLDSLAWSSRCGFLKYRIDNGGGLQRW